MDEVSINPRHQAVDAMAQQAIVEILQMKYRALCAIKLTASWHTRSLGQIRRYEAARLGERHG